jgi:ABC-2 type transport system permease protein
VSPFAVPGPRARLRDLIAAEWIKMRSLRSTYWVLALGGLIAIAINVNAVRSDLVYFDRPPGGWPGYDPLYHGLGQVSSDLMMLAAASVGAITIFGEYTTGMISTTLAAVPDRRAVVAAKVTVVTAVTLLLGAVVSVTSFFTTNAMLASRHVGLSIHDPGCLRAVAAYALIVPVSALIGLAFGAVLRHAAPSIVGAVVLLFILPLLFGGDRYKLLKEIGHGFPAVAELRLTLNPAAHTTQGRYPPTITEAWIVLVSWLVVATTVAIVAVRHRDV